MKYTGIIVLGTILLLQQLQPTTAAPCTAPGQVTGLTLREDDITNNLYVIWEAPSGTSGCDLSYRVTYSNNAPTPASKTFTTDDLYVVIDRDILVPCSTTTVTVTPVGASDGTTSTASTVLATRASTEPILRNMTTSCDSIQMTWEGQPYQENMCEVTHFQLFCLSDTHNFTIAKPVTDAQDRTFEILISTVLRPDIFYSCNGFMFVTLAGFSPESETITFWSNLDMVRDLTVVTNADVLRASWFPPLNSEECGVGYYVTYENEIQGTETVVTEDLYYDFPFQVIPCTEYKVSVTPISFTGSSGTIVSETYEPFVSIDRVENLEIADDGDSLTLSWAEVNIGRCDVYFKVEHYINDELHDTLETTDSSVSLTRLPCSQNVFTVTVVSSGSNGQAISVELGLSSADVDEISAVRNLQVSGNVVTWEAPISVGHCQLSYIVEHTSPSGTVTVITATNEAALSDLVPCTSNTVSVVGFAGALEGDAVETTFTADAEAFEGPDNLSTLPDLSSVWFIMGAESLEVNACPITEAIVSCTNDGTDEFERTISVTDTSSRRIDITLTDLEEDTIYTCFVRWTKDSANSNEIRFRTIPIPMKVVMISEVTETSFRASWIEEYGTEFVDNYQLQVWAFGPNNTVRSDCDVDMEFRTFDYDRNVFSAVFDGGLPNYIYTVHVVTRYNLGNGRNVVSAMSMAETLTSAPAAPEDLEIEFKYEGGTAYDVTGLISWIPPCELNGVLSSFDVTVTATFSMGGVDQSVEYSTSIAAEDPNQRYVYELTDINPFFRYVVTINTVAATRGPGRDIIITPPDVCSCT